MSRVALAWLSGEPEQGQPAQSLARRTRAQEASGRPEMGGHGPLAPRTGDEGYPEYSNDRWETLRGAQAACVLGSVPHRAD